MIVLAINPVLGSDAREREQLFQNVGGRSRVGDAVETERFHFRDVSGFFRLALIDGRFIGDFLRGNVHDEFAAVTHLHMAGVGDDADLGPRQIPLVENAFHFLFAALVDHDEHALLRFRKHEFVAAHVRRALGNFVEFDLDARAGARRHFAGGTCQTRRAHVLHAGDCAGGEQFETRFAHKFFHERIADLHRTALSLGGFLGQILRRKRRARETVAPRRRADVKHGITHALGRAARDLFVAQHAEAERVHERIALIRLVEIHLARDGRDAEAIAVMRDAADDAGEQATVVFQLRVLILICRSRGDETLTFGI